MGATRTQIYLTRAQRDALDERAEREGRTLADLVREAVDRYLETGSSVAVNQAAAETFGALVALQVPDRVDRSRSDRWPDW